MLPIVIRQAGEPARSAAAELEALYDAQRPRGKDVARVFAALAAIAIYAGLLGLAERSAERHTDQPPRTAGDLVRAVDGELGNHGEPSRNATSSRTAGIERGRGPRLRRGIDR